MSFGSLNSSIIRRDVSVYICILAHEGKVIALIAKASSRCSHWFRAAMLVSLGRDLHTEFYKFAWNVSANNSKTV